MNKKNQDKQEVEETIRPNHQEEMNAEINFYNNHDNPYKNAATRKNEQFSPREKDYSSLQNKHKFTPKTRRQSNPANTNSYEKTEEK